MQIKKTITTVLAIFCTSTAIAAPVDGGPSTDITPPPHGSSGSGKIKCGEGKYKSWEDRCCNTSNQDVLASITCNVIVIGDLIGSICGDEDNSGQHTQRMCCSNTGSGTQICINNDGEELDARSFRMV